VPTQVVEKEFWRLVSSMDEEVTEMLVLYLLNDEYW
jgi:hypothetical protein